jgi:hypothetical protein
MMKRSSSEKRKKFVRRKKTIENILGDRLEQFHADAKMMLEPEESANPPVVELICGMATENYVFSPILKYVIAGMLASDGFDVDFLYLPYLRADNVNFRAFIRHVITGIFVHGGVILRSIRECNVLKFLTNWDDRALGLDFCRTDVPESFYVENEIMVVFSPDRIPSMRNFNCFNGVFSPYLPQFMDLAQLHHLFLIKLENLSMNVVVAEPHPNFLEEMFKIKNLTNDADYAKFIQREVIEKVNRSVSNRQAAANLLQTMPSTEGTDGGESERKKYSRAFLEDVEEMQEFQLRQLDVRTTIPMMRYDEIAGLRTEQVRNTVISSAPAGMQTKQHIPNVIGEHLFENLAIQTKREIVQTLGLDIDAVPFLKKLRKEIEDILQLIFTHYVTPPFFEDMIYEEIAKELEDVQSFYEKTYIFFSDEDIVHLLKDDRFVSLHSTDYPNLQCFFSFNFIRAARKRTLKRDIERMLADYEQLKKVYEQTVEAFERDTISGDLSSFKMPAVRVKWGAFAHIDPFILTSGKRQVGEEEKAEKEERRSSRQATVSENAGNKQNVE